jgi:hypothetical protein
MTPSGPACLSCAAQQEAKACKTACLTTEITDGFTVLRAPNGQGNTHRLYESFTLALAHKYGNLTVSPLAVRAHRTYMHTSLLSESL